ncbi:class I adenylate-forming enzyme family protein [Sediminimonas qiaohouensis]|uniref:class I adenylate-forming enzyme family protein n=1 Tax=Sediminimonas qiaohouensis TaxID=552061 RepID=UPI000411DDC3|nr:AMP-binding protein [Sediminimonas qiaohouensis]
MVNIATWLDRRAAVDGDRPALFLGRDMVADYAGFDARAGAVAGWLAARGVMPGDRVALAMRNCPDYLCAMYGAWYAGAAVVPINAKLHAREMAWIIGDSGARIVFATPDLAPALQAQSCDGEVVVLPGNGEDSYVFAADPLAAPLDRAAEDLAWLFYTSGTTGTPKGVMITHRMLSAMALSYFADVDAVEAEDCTLYAAPMSHGAGLYNVMHVLVGARHVCPPSGGFDPGEILDLAAHFDRVHMFAAPTMVQRLTRHAKAHGASGAGLRSIVYGGGPMYRADIIEAVDHFGPVFIQIYGQGECPMCITALPRAMVADRTHPDWQARLASVGRAQSAVQVAISDGAGGTAHAGTAGEIMVRGDAVMPGYWRNDAASERALVDGWLMTGDVGVMDTAGLVTLRDRSKDMIISGGTNIYPREVEEALMTHDAVLEAAVVGAPDPEWGEIVVAFIVAAPGREVNKPALDAHCLERIARFKRPKRYVHLRELPKNNYGKVLKTELRRLLEEKGDE